MTKAPDVRAQPEILRRLDLIDPTLRAVFRALVSGDMRWPLYLWGPVGTGKTMAALCLCDHIRESRYLTSERLADAVMADNPADWKSLYEQRLVVVDELGTRQKVGDLHYQAIQRLSDIRERRNRVAVYVSNLSVPELASLYDDRIADRLTCGTEFKLNGESRRRTG